MNWHTRPTHRNQQKKVHLNQHIFKHISKHVNKRKNSRKYPKLHEAFYVLFILEAQAEIQCGSSLCQVSVYM